MGLGNENYGRALARLKRQGKDESEENMAVLESYMRHSWHRTHLGSHSKKFDMPENRNGQDNEEALSREMKSGINLTGGNFSRDKVRLQPHGWKFSYYIRR